MKWVPKWLVWLIGDDRNALHPAPMPTLKCVKCDRFVVRAEEKNLDVSDWLHCDDASPICEPIGCIELK